ncbi:MAG: FtsH protease activity modulator HflK [Bauldia sp.]
MPWNNQTGGPWKSGGNGGGPWGQGPRGGGSPNPPDLEDLLRRGQDRLKRVLPGGGGGRGASPAALVGIALVAIAFIGYYFFTFRVGADELGVVLRFGELNRQAQPGLNFRLPPPIETVYTPKVTRQNRTTVGLAQDDRNPGAQGRSIPQESLMLTGDENIVDIDFSVFWVIKDARAYLFNMDNPMATVKAVAESAMRQVVGRSEIQPLLTQAREITETQVASLMQRILDQYGAGVHVERVQLLKVDPPNEVIAAFRDVQAAQADQARVQNEAQTYANRVVPAARGQAAQILATANAYRDRVVAEAQGQADRFVKVYQAYKAAPEVTRQRMYLETIEQVLGGMDKVIIDDKGGGNGVVPYLPLGDMLKGAAAPATTPPANAARPATTTGQRP